MTAGRAAWLLAIGFAAGCPQASSPPDPPLIVERVSVPIVSGCQDTATLPFVVELGPGFGGRTVSLLGEDDQVLASASVEGQVVQLELPWAVPRGPVRGTLRSGDEELPVVWPTEVVPPEPPRLESLRLEGPAGSLSPTDLPAAAEESPWGDAIGVSDFSRVVVDRIHPHEALGVPLHVRAEACSDQQCIELVADESGFDLSPVAEATCAALPLRLEHRVRVWAESACGTPEVSLDLRGVRDDCDGDGVLVAEDCDDQLSIVSTPGTVASDGVLTTSVADTSDASEVVFCVDTDTEPFIAGVDWSGDVSVRSVGGVAQLVGSGSGPTVVVSGSAQLERLVVWPDRPSATSAGALGGPTVFAEQASSLRLTEVVLHGTLEEVEVGGALVGPAAGTLEVVGGRWVGGMASVEGGVARLSGGSLQGLVVTGGTALMGGGIANRGNRLEIVDALVEGNTADTGGGIDTDAELFVSGTVLSSNTASRGGGIAARLEASEVLDLRPSVVDLGLTGFFDNVATARGGGVHLEGGRALAVLVEGTGNQADQGGFGALLGADWIGSATEGRDNVAREGAALHLSGGSHEVVQSQWLGSAADQGAMWLGAGAAVSVQAAELSDGTGCAIYLEDGTAVLAGATGSGNDADLCGADFSVAFGPASCTASGCD